MSSLRESYVTIRARTLELCEPLKTEDYIPQPVDFVSPAKWHIAHTAWFFEEFVLSRYVDDYQRFDPDFAFLFNSYYNTVGERTLRADRGNLTRPTVQGVRAYRAWVDEHMLSILDGNPGAELRDIVILGLNHEQQHQELLITDLKYIFGHNPVFPVYQDDGALVNNEQAGQGWLQVSEGVYSVGSDGRDFCFDNEQGRHKVYLQKFEISQALVTNGEYMEFMNSGAYEDFNLWLEEGWAWVQAGHVRAPLYWHQVDGDWYQYTLGGLQKVRPGEVLCHVSYFEAAAFAEWKGLRLPTEFEWEIASAQLDWGLRWEWTNSAYLPYPQFEKADGAIGEYNGKFMINQMVLRGASVATAPGHSRSTYRNFFHPQQQWQFSGIRLAR
ncbi:MAG: ergothioneine biosynthesis protein EgtB [Xanthomonadales bacterium]|nr:ergothioneine biosynthesis protein EgtB [Xanthomonadales bacterium]